MRRYINIPIQFLIAIIFVLARPLAPASAADSKDQKALEVYELAIILKNGLLTGSFEKASITAKKELITTLINKGETLHAKRVAWTLLFYPRAGGRSTGAMALINTYDLYDPQEVSDLLSIDNDCLRTVFVNLAEGGYFREYPIARPMAMLLEDERYLRRHRQGRLVKILRALYHYNDISIVSSVAQLLSDPNKKVREVSARTLGKLTGHTFSRTGDMDFRPSFYFMAKAKIWWFINKDRPEYEPAEKHQEQRHRSPDLPKQTAEASLRSQVMQLQNKDFLVWAAAFNSLLEYGVEHESSFLIAILETASTNELDKVYTETLIRLIEFYNKKRQTTSEYVYKKDYDIREFCPN